MPIVPEYDDTTTLFTCKFIEPINPLVYCKDYTASLPGVLLVITSTAIGIAVAGPCALPTLIGAVAGAVSTCMGGIGAGMAFNCMETYESLQ